MLRIFHFLKDISFSILMIQNFRWQLFSLNYIVYSFVFRDVICQLLLLFLTYCIFLFFVSVFQKLCYDSSRCGFSFSFIILRIRVFLIKVCDLISLPNFEKFLFSLQILLLLFSLTSFVGSLITSTFHHVPYISEAFFWIFQPFISLCFCPEYFLQTDFSLYNFFL